MLGLRQNHFLLVNVYGLFPSLATHYVYYMENPEKQDKTLALFLQTGPLVQYVSDLLAKSDNIFKQNIW